jgi:phage-related protein
MSSTKHGKFAIVFGMRPITWIASSKDDLSVLPREVKASFGLRLYELQQGKTPLDMKPLPQFRNGRL